MKIVYLALGLWLLPGMLWAQSAEKENEFTMSMQIRPRAEYRNGAQLPRLEGDKAASFINNRARLSMEYKRSDLSMKISAQHVGVWGQDPQIDTNGRFIMNEAWAKLNFGAGFFAQLGRQTLSYGRAGLECGRSLSRCIEVGLCQECPPTAFHSCLQPEQGKGKRRYLLL